MNVAKKKKQSKKNENDFVIIHLELILIVLNLIYLIKNSSYDIE